MVSETSQTEASKEDALEKQEVKSRRQRRNQHSSKRATDESIPTMWGALTAETRWSRESTAACKPWPH
eukprot:1193987-Rhodomonas_salina.1